MSPLRAGLWALPSVLAYLVASLSGPGLTRWFPAGRVAAAGLAVMSAGFAVLALAGAEGLPAVVAGTVIFSVGLAPAYILTTDLVVSTVVAVAAVLAAAFLRPASRPAPPSAPEESYEGRCVPLTNDDYDLLSNR
jgi:DHA2 family multidrug resistance protein-like MFS transporter